MRLSMRVELEERFEWNPNTVKVEVTVQFDNSRRWPLTKWYPRDFLVSEFDVLWRAMGEELRIGIREDRNAGG